MSRQPCIVLKNDLAVVGYKPPSKCSAVSNGLTLNVIRVVHNVAIVLEHPGYIAMGYL